MVLSKENNDIVFLTTHFLAFPINILPKTNYSIIPRAASRDRYVINLIKHKLKLQ